MDDLSATLTPDSIYLVDVGAPSGVALFAQPAETAELWYRRMDHRNNSSLAHMRRLGLLHGCHLKPPDFVQTGTTLCEACIKVKTHQGSHTTPAVETTTLLHLLIVDMKGPLPISVSGCKYVVTVIDEACGNCAVGLIKCKSEAAAFVTSVIILWETQRQAPGVYHVQRVRSDNCTEFIGLLLAYMKPR